MDTTKISEKDSLKKWLNILKGQTSRTIILAIILLITMGSLRPDESSGLFPDQYSALKSRWRHCADIVLAGDSRVLIGLSPAEMSKTFKNKRIYNYGFDSAWFSEEYLKAVEDVLDPQSSERMIILAITPHSLTSRRDGKSDKPFEVPVLSRQDELFNRYLARIMHFFQPLSFKNALEGLIPAIADSHTTRKYYEDGWISVQREPINESRNSKRYRSYYTDRTVAEKNISSLLKCITDWQSRGIKVVGVLFPTCKEMYELENQISGFDEKEFASRFEQAGGKWISVDQTKYVSYDGSHLQKDSAVRFSNDFARFLYEAQN